MCTSRVSLDVASLAWCDMSYEAGSHSYELMYNYGQLNSEYCVLYLEVQHGTNKLMLRYIYLYRYRTSTSTCTRLNTQYGSKFRGYALRV